MKIAVVDPSGFTLPYDHCLCDALGAGGDDVRLYQRPARDPEEDRSGHYAHRPIFYRLSERVRANSRWLPYRALKGPEHLLDSGRFRSEVLGWGADVIHFQWVVLPWLDRLVLPGLGRRVPLVITVHDTVPFQGSPSSIAQEVGWIRSLSIFRRIIVHAESSRRALVGAGVDAGRIRTVPHGLFPGPRRLVGGEKRTLLFFGSIKPYKGVDLLLHAYARLPEPVRRRAPLRIAGAPQVPAAPLERLAESLGIAGTVEWDLGHVPEEEVPALLREARALIMPYRSIDASGVLALAIGSGVPVVASQIGVVPEVIEDGVQGLLVPPGDEEALARALAAVVDEALATRLEEGMARLRDGFPTWTEIARLTREAYTGA